MISKTYFRNVDIYGDMDKHDFQNSLKKNPFRRNVDIFGYMDKNRFFLNDLINEFYPDMLIFTKTRNDFSK